MAAKWERGWCQQHVLPHFFRFDSFSIKDGSCETAACDPVLHGQMSNMCQTSHSWMYWRNQRELDIIVEICRWNGKFSVNPRLLECNHDWYMEETGSHTHLYWWSGITSTRVINSTFFPLILLRSTREKNGSNFSHSWKKSHIFIETRVSKNLNMQKCNDKIDWMGLYVAFSDISATSRRPVLLVEEAGVPRENHRPAASNW